MEVYVPGSAVNYLPPRLTAEAPGTLRGRDLTTALRSRSGAP